MQFDFNQLSSFRDFKTTESEGPDQGQWMTLTIGIYKSSFSWLQKSNLMS